MPEWGHGNSQERTAPQHESQVGGDGEARGDTGRYAGTDAAAAGWVVSSVDSG